MNTKIIRVCDLETTGFTAEDGVCEVGWADIIVQDGSYLIEDYPVSYLTNPGRPIQPTASAIHHIIDGDVEDAPKFAELLPDVVTPFGESTIVALAAHGAKFERQFIPDTITGNIPWICTYKCALRLYPDAPRHSNQALRYYVKPPGLKREKAVLSHRAGPDAYVTMHLLEGMLKMAPLEDLIEWSSQPALQVTCHIGQYRGEKWADVPLSMLEWVSTRDFDEDVIHTVMHHIKLKRDLLRQTVASHNGHPAMPPLDEAEPF